MMSKILMSVALAAMLLPMAPAQSAQNVSYKYDALGRLEEVEITSGPGSGVKQTYQLDAAGNRLLYQVTAPGQSAITLTVSHAVVRKTAIGTTLTVEVSGASPGGTVIFTENGQYLGTAAVVGGEATITLEGFPPGVHSITTTYSGDGSYAPGNATFSIKVLDLSWLPAVMDLILSN